MKSKAFLLKLRPGSYGEYKRRHDELWPELAEVMKEQAIDMVICRHGECLFVYGMAPSEDAWEKAARDPVTPRWNAYMAEVLETDVKGDIIRIELEQAFRFGAFV